MMNDSSRFSLNRREALRCLAGACCSLVSRAAAPERPNIVVIVSDDHGYADLSCYDHPKEISTPNIDRIARSGVRFTQGYVSAYVCAPTRAALMTGRYQQRFGFYTASDSRVGLPLSEITMADILRKHGCATGAFGKWHLGIRMPYHPINRGFDEFYGFLGHGAHDYFDLKRQPEDFQSIWRNDKVTDDSGYLTDNLGREAVNFVRKHRDRPFFLYLAFNAVHTPLQAPEQTLRKYDTGRRNRDIYLAMLEHEDRAVGMLLDELEKAGLARNTLVFFLSDNGGARNNASSNGVLRDYKHSVYEGGIRVPFMVSWPARLPAGTAFHEPVICMDILPTAAAAAGVPLPADRTYDGKNLLPYLTGEARGPVHEWLFWDGGEGKRAVRHGRWKLVDNFGKLELFDLEADVGEKNDLSGKHPEIVQRLRVALEEWCSKNAPRIRSGDGLNPAPRRQRRAGRDK
jgi:arylsulfatase A-like enzyme